MSTLLRDIRYSIRSLLKRPGFVLVVVMTLGLGIGANTTIFSVVNAVLLRPLPFPHSEQLVTLWERNPKQGYEQNAVAAGNYVDWRRDSQSFSQLAIYAPSRFNLAFGDRAERLSGAAVSTSLFELLGVTASQGRVFSAEEEQAGKDQVVLISEDFHNSHFGSRTSIGETIALDGRTYTIVGVMPHGFHFPGGTGTVLRTFTAASADIWVPLVFDNETLQQRSSHSLQVIGRLKPDVTVAQATAEMNGIQQRLEQQYPMFFIGSHVKIIPLTEQIVGETRRPVLILWFAVGFVLLICCVNVANLLLSLSTSRQRELAVRAALGAGRMRIIRQLLTESVLLALTGGIVGTLAAAWGVRALATFVPTQFPRREEISINLLVLCFTLVISLLTGVIFGLAPAWHSARLNLIEALRSSARNSSSGGRRGLRSSLVITEIALALMLLIGATLMIRSFLRLQRVSPGFDSENVLTLEFSVPQDKYTREKRPALLSQLLERTRSLPGVEAVAAARSLPLSGDNMNYAFDIEGRPFPEGRSPGADLRFVTPDYFKTMGIPLVKGRAFTEGDAAGAPNALLINEAMARHYFNDEEPIGKRLVVGINSFTGQIVGVVGDVKHENLNTEVRDEIYLNYVQAPFWRDMTLLVRTSGEPLNAVTGIRTELAAVDRQIPIARVRTMQTIVGESVSQPRFRGFLLGLFGLTALVLAALGIYGVMSYSVTQRTNEIGIRMALGAQLKDVRRLVLHNGMSLALVGIVIGLGGAFALTRVLANLLFETSTTDLATFIGAPLGVALVALAAAYIPARRATKVDPLVAMRSE